MIYLNEMTQNDSYKRMSAVELQYYYSMKEVASVHLSATELGGSINCIITEYTLPNLPLGDILLLRPQHVH